jgi:hypothetical protein
MWMLKIVFEMAVLGSRYDPRAQQARVLLCHFRFGSKLGKKLCPSKRRARVPLDRLGDLDGNMRRLLLLAWQVLGVRIARGAPWLFAKRIEAEAWVGCFVARSAFSDACGQ